MEAIQTTAIERGCWFSYPKLPPRNTYELQIAAKEGILRWGNFNGEVGQQEMGQITAPAATVQIITFP